MKNIFKTLVLILAITSSMNSIRLLKPNGNNQTEPEKIICEAVQISNDGSCGFVAMKKCPESKYCSNHGWCGDEATHKDGSFNSKNFSGDSTWENCHQDNECKDYPMATAGGCGPEHDGMYCSGNGKYCSKFGWCQLKEQEDKTNSMFDFEAIPEKCRGDTPIPPTPTPPTPTPPTPTPPTPTPPTPTPGPQPDLPEDVKAAAKSGMMGPDVTIDFENPQSESNPANVKRAMNVISEQTFNDTFKMRLEVYDYKSLMKAIGRYPTFCGEKADTETVDLQAMCARELAVLIAHSTQETGAHWPNNPDNIPEWQQSFRFVEEVGCESKPTKCTGYGQLCKVAPYSDWYPCSDEGYTLGYYGRGAIQLSYNYNYGAFSLAAAGDTKTFLDAPDRIAKEGEYAFLASLWFYMTPQNPKPSMHEVVVGLFKPNADDSKKNIVDGFGATTNIINGGIECNSQGAENAKSQNRIDYFTNWMKFFKADSDSFAQKNLGCKDMGQFGSEGAAAQRKLYWIKQGNDCVLDKWAAKYLVTIKDAYELCVKGL